MKLGIVKFFRNRVEKNKDKSDEKDKIKSDENSHSIFFLKSCL